MPQDVDASHRSLLEAVAFAARAHRSQLRKDGQTPYASHVFRVCLVVSHVFGITDDSVLTAAVLHDTIEDTNTDFDDIQEKWGPQIARWVALLSKDKRQEYEPREDAYCRDLAGAPWQVQVRKLADLFDNILDMIYLPAEKRPEALHKKGRYLEALRSNLKPEAAAAFQIVSRLYDQTEAELARSARR